MDPQESKGVMAMAVAMIVVTSVVTALRCLAVLIVRKGKFRLDDYLAIADLPIVVAIAGITLAMITMLQKNMSHPPVPVFPPIGMPMAARNMLISIHFLYIIGLSLPRLSIVWFYYKIFGRTKQWFFHSLCTMGVICLLWLLANIIVTSVKCIPLQAQFSFGPLAHGKCININAYGIALLCTSIAIDLGLLILPMPMIYNIKTSRAKRLSIALAFVCGGSVVIFTTGRLILAFQVNQQATSVGYVKSKVTAAFIQLEAAMSLVSVSLPTIFTLVRHLYLRSAESIKKRTSSMTFTDILGFDRSAKSGSGNSTDRKPLNMQSTQAGSKSKFTTIGSNASAFDSEDLGKLPFPVPPRYVVVKQEFHVQLDEVR